MVGNFQAAETQPKEPSGYYQSILNRKTEEPKVQTFDLDEELRKLERIKQQRQNAYFAHRDKVNKAKMEQMT